MTARIFRLSEIHQKIDARLRLEQSRRRPDPGELTRLARMKQRAKRLLARLLTQPRYA